MSTIKRIVIATAVAGTVAATAGSALAAGPDRAQHALARPASGQFVIPPDYVQLTDDTGTITVAVPNTWTDTSTLPFANDAGVTIPRITAATDYQVFHDTFDAPGLEYVALPYDPDQQGVMTDFGLTSGCSTDEVQPYNDGAFVGLHGIWTGCGPTSVAEWHQLVVSPADNSHTLVLQIQITSAAELTVLQNIFDSFNTGTGTTPLPTVPPTGPLPTSPLPTAPVPTAPLPTAPLPTAPLPTAALPTAPLPTSPLPTAPLPTSPLPTAPVPTSPLPTVPGTNPAVPAGFVQLVDDSQTISMVVPNTWTDIDTTPFVNDDGTQAPKIEAATNIQAFRDTFDAPGAVLAEIPFTLDPTAFITESGLDAGLCTSNVIEPFNNGPFTGNIGRWTGCGATGQAEWDMIVASPADQTVSYLIVTQSASPADQAAMTTVQSSFGPAGQGGTTVPSLVPIPTGVPVPPSTDPLSTSAQPTIPTPATAPGG